MLDLKATSSFVPSARAASTTPWVVSHPVEVTVMMVTTLATTAVQAMSLILLPLASRRAAFSEETFHSAALSSRFLAASISSVVVILSSHKVRRTSVLARHAAGSRAHCCLATPRKLLADLQQG